MKEHTGSHWKSRLGFGRMGARAEHNDDTFAADVFHQKDTDDTTIQSTNDLLSKAETVVEAQQGDTSADGDLEDDGLNLASGNPTVNSSSVIPDDTDSPSGDQHPVNVPRFRRMGILSPPQNYSRPLSLNDLPLKSPSEPTSSSPVAESPKASPPVPPRSPLRPVSRKTSTSTCHDHLDILVAQETGSSTLQGVTEVAPDQSGILAEKLLPSLSEVMPLLQNHSFGSLSALLESLDPSSLGNPQENPTAVNTPSVNTATPRPISAEKGLPVVPDNPAVSSPMNNDEPEPSTSSLSRAPSIPKRTHALLELLTSERAYASDLALIRDIHIPLALGQPAPFHAPSPTPQPASSGSSSRTLSTASDSSTTSSQMGPPMTREDTRIIFSNVSELAMFSDTFVDRIEIALGSALKGGVGNDSVGALFLEIISSLEPLYMTYITRHPSALTHLSSLPPTPALTAYLEKSRSLASSLTHAWDLPSLLIKPVQRLLKYPLLLAAILDETPDSHPDKANLREARNRLEEVARDVNEGRRRWEVVKEVLNAKAGEVLKKKGVGVAASVNLNKMKSLRGVKLKESNEEAEHVALMENELKRYSAFVKQLAKDIVEWRTWTHALMTHLRNWAIAFGNVIGLSADQRSEAFEAFYLVIDGELLVLTSDLEKIIKENLLPGLAHLRDSMQAPLRLLDAMNTLEPLHYGLANLNVSKHRPQPALLEASQSYLALRGQLSAELPRYLELLDKGITAVLANLARIQVRFWENVRARWGDLWDALRVDGERNAGAEETLRVWWERWIEADRAVAGLTVTNAKKLYADRPARKFSSGTSSSSMIDYLHAPPSPSSTATTILPPMHKHRSHGSADMSARRGNSGNSGAKGLARRHSNDSLRTGKSASLNNGRPETHNLALPRTTEPALTPPRKPKPERSRSTPIVSPLRKSTSSSSSSNILGAEKDVMVASPVTYVDYEDDSVDLKKRTSLRTKLSDTLHPPSQHRRLRSSSIKSLGAPLIDVPAHQSSDTVSLPPHRSPSHTLRSDLKQARTLYACRAVHTCIPPDGVSYRRLPFFQIRVGDVYDVLKEYGHPSSHEHLPLYVDDGEDCLLLVRNKNGDVGWALASFLIPLE